MTHFTTKVKDYPSLRILSNTFFLLDYTCADC